MLLLTLGEVISVGLSAPFHLEVQELLGCSSFVGKGAQTSLISVSPKIIYGGFFLSEKNDGTYCNCSSLKSAILRFVILGFVIPGADSGIAQ